METVRNLIASVILFIHAFTLQAATYKAVADGNWYNPGTWDLGSVPGCGDIVLIPVGYTVNMDNHVMIDETSMPPCNTPTFIQVAGTLDFTTGKKMELACGSAVEILVGGTLNSGGGGGSSNWLKICGALEWKSSDGTVNGYALFGAPIGLPTEFISFTSEFLSRNRFGLTWTVASEHSVDHFIIEYATDAKHWSNFTTQKSIGDHTDEYMYQINHELTGLLAATVYFRLTSVDNDGTQTILSVISQENNGSTIQIYPNPVRQDGQVTVDLQEVSDEMSTIYFYNQLGALVLTEVINPNEKSVSIQASSIGRGVYYVKTATTELAQVVKLVIE